MNKIWQTYWIWKTTEIYSYLTLLKLSTRDIYKWYSLQVLFKIFNTRFVKRKKNIHLEITEYLLVGITHTTLNILFCFLSFSFLWKIPIFTVSKMRFLHTIEYERNPIKFDLLDSRFFVFEENCVAFDIKI